MNIWPTSVLKLKAILGERKDLAAALQSSIQLASIDEVPDMNHFYMMLIRMLNEAPTRQRMSDDLGYFHYITSSSPGNILYEDPTFSQWLWELASERGAFLDTTDSIAGLPTFINDPDFHIEEYDPGPGGWFTFNQFFTRRAKPGKRPIAAPSDDNIIVAPTDGTYLGCWPIDDKSKVWAKGSSWPICQLLENSEYKDAFANGIFTHTYLDVNDYHRFHIPVSGTVKQLMKISGKLTAKTVREDFKTLDEIGFQFTQIRGCMILDSPVGWVALLPVGIGHVSSVTFTVDPGTVLRKGEEFGYFAYGGSDMITLFQEGRVALDASPGKHYKQGSRIGQSIRSI